MQSLNSYADWRLRSGVVPVLREEPVEPPERLLQAIWFHQRLRRDKLTTLDGQRLRVLHPGFWNREAGPDFRGAVLQWENGSPVSGDVEVDLRANGWTAHRHHCNPAFQDVTLHVVWDADSAVKVPTLALKSVLDAPLGELALWLNSETIQTFPTAVRGQCSGSLRGLSPERLTELLHQAALVRLHSKAAQFQARARQAGWEQALWEGIFRALGYKHNAWPMQLLAEARSRVCVSERPLEPLALQARLLGIGALLPGELPRGPTGTDRYVRRLWDLWWRERESFAEYALPRSVWRFGGLRPANHPQRRLALAAHWLAEGGLNERLEKWCVRATGESQLISTLWEELKVERDEFWSWHWTLRSARLPKPQPLLGAARVTDLAMNAILPWLWVRAVEGKNEPVRLAMERRYLAWPPAEDNAVLKLARQRLLDNAAGGAWRGAAAQQGLLQIVRDFCEHANAVCRDCRFPDLVRQWAS